MSTPLYSIFVRERDGSHLTIYVSSFHLRETLPNPANPTFFLSILCHENYQGSLLEAVVGERHVDEDWMAEQAPAYISTVTLLEIEDYPPQSGEYGVQPGAAYRLTASHPDWIAHLNRGALWETSAYQIPPSRHVTSNGKPWEALFRDLMKNWKE